MKKRVQPKIGIFESSNYMDGLFPSLKIQKPGYDLYGTTTLVLFLILLFIFLFYERYTNDPQVFVFMHGQSAIFKGEMGIMLTLISGIIIVERLANRTDTKAVNEDG